MLQADSCNFLKKRLWHSCFSANFTKFLTAPFLQNTYGGCLWKVWLTYFISLVSLYTPWKGFRFGKIQFFRILKKLVTVLSKMALFIMYLPLSYKSSIILSLLKIVTLDFTMHILMILTCFLKCTSLEKIFYMWCPARFGTIYTI